MKNKRGFTTVELLVSFTMTLTIVIILFQIIIALKNLYINNGIKTQLLNKQGLITNQIASALNENKISRITRCGTDCYRFSYKNNQTEELQIDKLNRTIAFGNWTNTLAENSRFGSIMIDSYQTPTVSKENNNAFIIVDIPIYNDNFKDKNFGIHFIYQYNTNTDDITID